MKKMLIFIFTMSFLLFIGLTENVFAESLIPPYAYMGNEAFITAGSVLDKYHNEYMDNGAGVPNFNIPVTLTWEDAEDYQQYPYLLIYFKSNADNISVSRNSSCNTSCFSSGISLVKLGKTSLIGWPYESYLYALVVPYNKMSFYDNWAVYRVDDVFNFSSPSTGLLVFQFVNIFSTKDTTILNNPYSIEQQQKNDTQNIINNNNTNTQNIINNQNQNANQQHQDMQELNDTMTSEEAPTTNDVSSKTSEWSNKLAGTGPVSQMVLMPITLLNGYVSGMNATCQPYNLGSLMGTDIVLPCINVSNYLGSTLWNVIDILFSGFMIYAIGKKFVKIFNDFTNLRDNQMDDLYGGGK